MNYEEFLETINTHKSPPAGLSVHSKSLWLDKKGDWQAAHDLIDQLDDPTSAHVHAYLHRVEGDLWNARYWYNRAKQPVFEGSLQEEWTALVKLYLA
ncbi:hypothetical protein PQ465_05470 [Sphingobacterium oryzagri]|uniref:Tetratricopeptide repeat protein n=1 Tax=Sphingobacterium oryzagri TaxID=3025669 RepID=A0ABY7WR88_9SPHI|nr:hypothetical protein [Sphingobacterium sp. KACC 22765]WDF69824.1 hypothetical protein PQ465_05470 [Sphingobacterium sp. KACC 22765]